MRFFGLISLIVALGLGVWFISLHTNPTTSSSSSSSGQSTYAEAVNVAREITGAAQSSKKIEVYEGVSVAESVAILDLSGRNLDGSLKAEIRHLSGLEVLDISRNNFTGLPAEVGQLSELKVLNLSYNPLTGLPHELGNLQRIEELDLRGTQYSEFDLEIIRSSLPEATVIFID